MLNNLLQRRIIPSATSHGGISGRHIVSNASVHRDSDFILVADIKSFYPSIRYERVYDLFRHDLALTPDAARLATRLCTYRHHVALGLATSPIIAEGIFAAADACIADMCKKEGLRYSRFVDDITISGPFNLDEKRSGVLSSLAEIVERFGFRLKPDKSHAGGIGDGKIEITKLRFRGRRLDVSEGYLKSLDELFGAAETLAAGRPPSCQFYCTGPQMLGRLHFVGWIRPSRLPGLLARFHHIDWRAVKRNAVPMNMQPAVVRLVPVRE